MRLSLILALLLVCLLVGTVSGTNTMFWAVNDSAVSDGTNNPFLVMRSTHGDGIQSNPSEGTTFYAGRTSASSSPGVMDLHLRGLVAFNTSSLPDDAIITDAKFSFVCHYKNSDLGVCDFSVINYNGTNEPPWESGDYDATDFDRWATDVPYASVGANGVRNNATLNSLGISNISLTGNTTLMLTHSCDTDAINLSEATSVSSGFRLQPVKSSTGYGEKLYLTYYSPPVADFSAPTTTPTAGDTVTFTDASVDSPTSWNWSFGDGTNSTSQNPTHIYESPGTYAVTLWITTPVGGDGEIKTDYIIVATAPPSCPISLSAMYNVTGDGTNETDKLNDAFDYIRSIGEPSCRVDFPVDAVIRLGRSDRSSSWSVNMSSNLELNGNNATLKVVDGFGSGSNYNLIQVQDDTWWHNLNVHGNYPNLAGSIDRDVQILGDWVLIENSHFWNGTEYFVQSYRADNIMFRGNTMSNCTQYGIATGGSTSYSTNVTVTNNSFYGMLGSPAVKIRGTRNGTITWNHVIIAPNDPGAGYRFYTDDEGNENILVENNTVEHLGTGGTSYGLSASATNPCINCIFRNNTINNTYYCIYDGQTFENSSILIENNVCTNTRRAGLLLYGNYARIFNNTFDRGVYFGLAGSGSVHNTTFRYNVISRGINYGITPIYGNGDGIYLGGPNVRDNTIDFNVITVANHGINVNTSFGNSNYTTITNNVITSVGACIFDLGNFTTYSNNTCNGAMDPVIVSFTKNKASGNTPLSVTLTDTSTGPTIMSRGWNATNSSSITGGNGTRVTVGSTSPLSVTLTTGNWTVDLTACDAVGACNTTAAQWVNVTGDGLILPSFTLSRTHIVIPQGVYVNDTSSSIGIITRRNWSWGDGTANATTLGATHYYTIGPRYSIINLEVCNSIYCNSTYRTVFIRRG